MNLLAPKRYRTLTFLDIQKLYYDSYLSKFEEYNRQNNIPLCMSREVAIVNLRIIQRRPEGGLNILLGIKKKNNIVTSVGGRFEYYRESSPKQEVLRECREELFLGSLIDDFGELWEKINQEVNKNIYSVEEDKNCNSTSIVTFYAVIKQDINLKEFVSRANKEMSINEESELGKIFWIRMSESQYFYPKYIKNKNKKIQIDWKKMLGRR